MSLQNKFISHMENNELGKDRQIIQQKTSKGVTVKRYLKGRLLGRGGFAKCYEVQSLESNKKYAAKIIEKSSLTRSKAKEKLVSEIRIHKSLESPYVVKFEHYFEDPDNYYIMLELCPNQTLNELLKRRKRILQIQVKYYIYQIACALKDIHGQKVIHRDLKLGNLFLTDKLEVRIGDFGLAAKLNSQGEKRKTMCGTPNYIAPEILQNHHGHSYQVDIWSLGVITYAFLIGRPPFETNDVKTTYSKIKQCNYYFPQNVSISRCARNFISKMLQRDPMRRATLDQILNDQFLAFNSFPKSLPISTLACPPNSNFLKQFSIPDSKDSIEATKQEYECENTTRGHSKTYKNPLNSDRGDSSTKAMTRAASNERVFTNNAVQRAASTAALMSGRRILHKLENKSETKQFGPLFWVVLSQEIQKFGVCYLLSSNAVGMRFNDSTCLISNANFTQLRYIDPLVSQPKQPQIYNANQIPQKLTKKMKIISYYYRELMNKKQQMDELVSNEQRILRQRLKHKESTETAMTAYVIKFYKTSKVNAFWFNNKDYQVVFKDLTQLLVSQNNAIYCNKVGERKHFLLSSLDEQSQQIKKRMNYVLKVFQKIKSAGVKTVQLKQNIPHTVVRSSSVTKVQNSKPKTLLRGSASTARLSNYRLIK